MVQIDDPALTYFCDSSITPEHHDERLRISELTDPATWLPAAVRSINSMVEGMPRRAAVEVQVGQPLSILAIDPSLLVRH